MTIRFRTTLLAAVTALACSAAMSADAPAKADQEFFNKAAAGGMFEVEAGKLAESRGQGAQVKSFGAMLVKDHSTANDELKALASRKGVTLPAALPKEHQETLDKLGKSKDFDKDFIQEVGLKDHKKDISLFEKTSKDAKDPDVKAFAAKTLPTLKMHLEHAEGLKKAAK